MRHFFRALVLIVVPVVIILAFPWVFRAIRPSVGFTVLDKPSLLVPQSFGEYGYYRGDNVDEWIRKPAQFSGGASQCSACHVDVAKTWGTGIHTTVNCEACHGPAAAHVKAKSSSATAATSSLAIQAPRSICVLCHEAVVGKPDGFPTVIPSQHAGNLDCTTCHNPHSPLLSQAKR